jgi:hypothetical protein
VRRVMQDSMSERSAEASSLRKIRMPTVPLVEACVTGSSGRDRLCIEAAAPTASQPLRPGSAADVQRRRPPVGGEHAEHLKMAASFIYKRMLKVIFKLLAEHARTQGKAPFLDFHGHFQGDARQPDR